MSDYKSIEVRQRDGTWVPLEFEACQIGDTIRIVKGAPGELGKHLVVLSVPKRCEPAGNWEFEARVLK